MQADSTIKMRRGRDAQGKVMDLGPSPRYVVGRKEVRRFFCDGEHDQWVLYLSSTWRNRHQIPWNPVVVARRCWEIQQIECGLEKE
jgi:hypothetical protein